MIGILVFIFFYIWYKHKGGKAELEKQIRAANARAKTIGGSREDYLRAYYGESERQFDGHRQNFDGSSLGDNSRF
jgi:hypothetical protein